MICFGFFHRFIKQQISITSRSAKEPKPVRNNSSLKDEQQIVKQWNYTENADENFQVSVSVQGLQRVDWEVFIK